MAEEPPGPGERIVVLGETAFAVTAPWGRGITFDTLSDVATDSAGTVFALQRSDPPVVVFDREGELVRTFGSGVILDGHAISVDGRDRVAVVDRDAHQIVLFDAEGRVLHRLGQRARPRLGAPFNHPTDIAFAADGEIFVSDGYGNTCVHRFAADGTFLATWGERGEAEGAFSTPHAVWVDRSDRVLVADRENDRVQVFDRDGAFLAAWGDVYRPMDIIELADGGILVSDQVPRVTRFAPDGRLAGRCRPVLNGAHGLWAMDDGRLVLAEMVPSRLAMLTPVP